MVHDCAIADEINFVHVCEIGEMRRFSLNIILRKKLRVFDYYDLGSRYRSVCVMSHEHKMLAYQRFFKHCSS